MEGWTGPMQIWQSTNQTQSCLIAQRKHYSNNGSDSLDCKHPRSFGIKLLQVNSVCLMKREIEKTINFYLSINSTSNIWTIIRFILPLDVSNSPNSLILHISNS